MANEDVLAQVDEERESRLSEVEAAVVRTIWTPLGALLHVPVPWFRATRGLPIVMKQSSAAPADLQTGEHYGLDRHGRVVFSRDYYAHVGSVHSEELLHYGPDELVTTRYEIRVSGREFTWRMEAQSVGVARPASLTPDTYVERSRFGTTSWRMAYDEAGRCREILSAWEAPDGATGSEGFALEHDERGLLRVIDVVSGEAVFKRLTRPVSTDLREAAAVVIPMLIASVEGHPQPKPDAILTLMFAGPAVPFLAWIPRGGHEDPMCFPDSVLPGEGLVLPPATVELLGRTQQHIAGAFAHLDKYAKSLRRGLAKATGIRGIRLTWDDLSPLGR